MSSRDWMHTYPPTHCQGVTAPRRTQGCRSPGTLSETDAEIMLRQRTHTHARAHTHTRARAHTHMRAHTHKGCDTHARTDARRHTQPRRVMVRCGTGRSAGGHPTPCGSACTAPSAAVALPPLPFSPVCTVPSRIGSSREDVWGWDPRGWGKESPSRDFSVWHKVGARPTHISLAVDGYRFYSSTEPSLPLAPAQSRTPSHPSRQEAGRSGLFEVLKPFFSGGCRCLRVR